MMRNKRFEQRNKSQLNKSQAVMKMTIFKLIPFKTILLNFFYYFVYRMLCTVHAV